MEEKIPINDNNKYLGSVRSALSVDKSWTTAHPADDDADPHQDGTTHPDASASQRITVPSTSPDLPQTSAPPSFGMAVGRPGPSQPPQHSVWGQSGNSTDSSASMATSHATAVAQTTIPSILTPVTSSQESSRIPPPLPSLPSPQGVWASSFRDKPKTGNDMPFCAPQVHKRFPGEPLEPFYRLAPGLLDDLLAADARRLDYPTDVMNVVVYDCIDPNPQKKSMQTVRLDDGALSPWWVLRSLTDQTLVFESRFESGNLRRAIQVYEHEYDLVLRPDVNTTQHVQWFYFAVRNMEPRVPYKFNVVNLMKSDSMFSHGMKPAVYSVHNANTHGTGWVRGGTDIAYYSNGIKRKGGSSYHTMTFTYVFEHANDTVFFAYGFPYTYTDLQDYLARLEADPQRRQHVRRRPMCQTLAGNTCELLTITSFSGDPAAMRLRKGVIICARVHPGETVGSLMAQGLMDFLTGESEEANLLRNSFVFKVVPMLNPDGVINGNTRCSMAGVDLNRRWFNPSKKVHPTIYWTKQMVQRLIEDRGVAIFCDFHGHSRKCNVFMYGCENPANPTLRFRERVIPRIMTQHSPHFCYPYCNFKIQKSKESTARVVLRREFGIVNTFTMEASMCGCNFGPYAGTHFNQAQLEQMGAAFCQTLVDIVDPEQSRVATVWQDIDAQSAGRNGDSTNPLAGGNTSSASDASDLESDNESDRDVEGASGSDQPEQNAQGTAFTQKFASQPERDAPSGRRDRDEASSNTGFRPVPGQRDRAGRARGAGTSAQSQAPGRTNVSSSGPHGGSTAGSSARPHVSATPKDESDKAGLGFEPGVHVPPLAHHQLSAEDRKGFSSSPHPDELVGLVQRGASHQHKANLGIGRRPAVPVVRVSTTSQSHAPAAGSQSSSSTRPAKSSRPPVGRLAIPQRAGGSGQSLSARAPPSRVLGGRGQSSDHVKAKPQVPRLSASATRGRSVSARRPRPSKTTVASSSTGQERPPVVGRPRDRRPGSAGVSSQSPVGPIPPLTSTNAPPSASVSATTLTGSSNARPRRRRSLSARSRSSAGRSKGSSSKTSRTVLKSRRLTTTKSGHSNTAKSGVRRKHAHAGQVKPPLRPQRHGTATLARHPSGPSRQPTRSQSADDGVNDLEKGLEPTSSVSSGSDPDDQEATVLEPLLNLGRAMHQLSVHVNDQSRRNQHLGGDDDDDDDIDETVLEDHEEYDELGTELQLSITGLTPGQLPVNMHQGHNAKLPRRGVPPSLARSPARMPSLPTTAPPPVAIPPTSSPGLFSTPGNNALSVGGVSMRSNGVVPSSDASSAASSSVAVPSPIVLGRASNEQSLQQPRDSPGAAEVDKDLQVGVRRSTSYDKLLRAASGERIAAVPAVGRTIPRTSFPLPASEKATAAESPGSSNTYASSSPSSSVSNQPTQSPLALGPPRRVQRKSEHEPYMYVSPAQSRHPTRRAPGSGSAH